MATGVVLGETRLLKVTVRPENSYINPLQGRGLYMLYFFKHSVLHGVVSHSNHSQTGSVPEQDDVGRYL